MTKALQDVNHCTFLTDKVASKVTIKLQRNIKQQAARMPGAPLTPITHTSVPRKHNALILGYHKMLLGHHEIVGVARINTTYRYGDATRYYWDATQCECEIMHCYWNVKQLYGDAA